MDLSNIRKHDKIKVLTPKTRWLTVTNYLISGGVLKFVYTQQDQFTPDQIVGHKPY